MASNRTVGLIGAALGLVAGILVTVVVMRDTDDDTNIVLGTSNSSAPCVVSSKEDKVFSKAGHKVKWWIRDFTCKKNETVTIGNFRTVEASNNTNCEAATEGGALWPFDASENVQYRQANPGGKIDLKVKSTISPSEYYYDVCTGSGAQQAKSDPRLVIEP